MAEAPSFFASVYALVAQIPPGFVASYGQLARMLGAPRAARQKRIFIFMALLFIS